RPHPSHLSLSSPASEWAPQNAGEAEGRGWQSPPKPWHPAGRDPSGLPLNATNPGGATPAAGDPPAGPQLEPPASTAATAGCRGCPEEGDPSALPPKFSSEDASQAAVTWAGDGGTVPLGSPEEPGSGERPTRVSLPNPEGFGGLTAAPSSPPVSQFATGSAESDLLLVAKGSATPRTPTPGDANPVLGTVGDVGHRREFWGVTSSPAPAQGARGRTDLTWLEKEEANSPGTAEPPADRTASEIIDVDYYDLFEGGEGLGGFPGGGRGAAGSAQRREPEGAATPWALHELYDDFTPFDEADFYPTTSFYADGDEEEELEEDEEEEEEEEDGLEDENGYHLPASPVPGAQPAQRDLQPTGQRDGVPPQPPGVADGTHFWGASPRRCNTQDYTWHKGMRCEAIVTDFQVMCVAVGSAALVVLLLFMLTVFFAKKLYLLKTENSKLRKTKYRTPSELHNDNFSLSTIAEGSHPN
ncbi:CSPG5 protein, partial [Centropus unirufus]|nr:CSPG5 protein [Centropus unirufus]